MIDTIARRRMTLNGKTYQKGDIVPMPLQQFETDLGPNGIGWVKRVPKRKPAAKAISTETKSSDTAD